MPTDRGATPNGAADPWAFSINRVRQLNEMTVEQLRVMLKGYSGDWRQDTDSSRHLPPPPLEKPVPSCAERIRMPLPSHSGAMPLQEVIAARRSLREYLDESLTLDDLSFLLWASQGITSVESDDEGDVVQRLRAAPSAGARYPFETYIALNRVKGFAPGLYRFAPGEHELILVREDASLAAGLRKACYDEAFIEEAAAVFIWSAIPYRMEWKYAYITHRMLAVEAGHICQLLCMAAVSIGAGACPVMAYHQRFMDDLLGLDGVDEFAFYLASVGKNDSGGS